MLRQARDEDLPRVDELTVICYTAIQASYVALLGEECYERVRHNPELTWEERKTRQNRQLYQEHPEWVWVLEEDGKIFGFITFYLFPQQGYGHIDNNGLQPEFAGKGWGSICTSKRLSIFGVRGCAMPTWTRDSIPPIYRRAGRMKPWALTEKCRR